uniref:Tc1-like transposase DDE domain-containing protein n=1 Tax=Sinocyclocheilus rhinocerous TaxID=307959 RepID=A0A673JES4_9TELE
MTEVNGDILIARVQSVSDESAGTLKMMDWPPQSPNLNPIEQIWGELENKQGRSIVHLKESLWLELQKSWDNINVEVLRKYIDTMPERCAAVIAAKDGHQILKLKVDTNSTTHFI